MLAPAPRSGAISKGAGILPRVRALPRRLRALARRLLTVDLWNVGLVEAPIQSFLIPGFVPEIHWMPSSGLASLAADPFGLVDDGRVHVLYERLDFAEGRGYLVARRLGPRGFDRECEPERVVLRLPFHISYPFLVRHGGEIYCVPESSEAGEVALYHAERFPDRWTKTATLLEGFAGIDATLLRHAGRWWCFVTEKGDGHERKLRLFHADELVGPWRPHRRDPVKTDVRSARGAGTPFVHEGVLYRPSQDYSQVLEGRITLNRVRALDPEHFDEEPVATLGPFPGPFPDKFHTLSAVGDWTLVDGCREVSILRHPDLLRFKLRRAFAALARRRASRSQKTGRGH